MRIVSYLHRDGPVLGARIDATVVNLTAVGLPDRLEAFLALGDAGMAGAHEAIARSNERVRFADIQLLAPLRSPSKAIAVGLNYVDHAAESKFDLPTYPVLFHRYETSWVGHGAPLVRPHVSNQFDYEGELVIVIGKPGRYIEKSRALEHVAGYSIFNDGSLRDYQFKSTQWMMGKNFDDSGSFGPEFVTSDELPAGAKGLQLRTRLNGKTVQDANIDDMIFDVATLIQVCSEPFALKPGDMIISGTPSGVGLARTPPLYMQAGDLCEVEIDGLGILSNPIVDETT